MIYLPLAFKFTFYIYMAICFQGLHGHAQPLNQLPTDVDLHADYNPKESYASLGNQEDKAEHRSAGDINLQNEFENRNGYEKGISGIVHGSPIIFPLFPFRLRQPNRESKIQSRENNDIKIDPKYSEEIILLQPKSKLMFPTRFQPTKKKLATREKLDMYYEPLYSIFPRNSLIKDQSTKFIIIPPNSCPRGYEPDHNGDCREVFLNFHSKKEVEMEAFKEISEDLAPEKSLEILDTTIYTPDSVNEAPEQETSEHEAPEHEASEHEAPEHEASEHEAPEHEAQYKD